MAVEIKQTTLSRGIIEEMGPLLDAHFMDTEKDRYAGVDGDWLAYQNLQDRGMFYFYTLRVDGVLAGYVGYLLSPSLHHKAVLGALCDLIYVAPIFRGKMFASKMMRIAEKDMKELGAQEIMQSVKVAHDFGPILERLGYEMIEHVYSKRIA